MSMIWQALREDGATVSMTAVSSILLLLGHVASGLVSLKTKLLAVLFISFGLLYPLQCILVGKRRCSGHWLVQYGAMAAYYLPTALAFYAVNVLCSSHHLDLGESFPFIIHNFLILLGLTLYLSSPTTARSAFSNMRAYSLHDSLLDRWRFVLCVVYLACAEWEWTRISSANRGMVMQIVNDLGLGWASASGGDRGLVLLLVNMSSYFFIAFVFLLADKTPESTLDCQIKAVADYMKKQASSKSSSRSSSPFFDGDANSSLQLMNSCRYPFVQKGNGEWISIKKLLEDQPDLPNRDKDIWLSYSLSRLLARRYYRFHCAEEGDDRVRRFVLADLGTTDGYKRAFTIVEVQLAFLHDHFFTLSHHIMESSSSYYLLPYQMQASTAAQWPGPSVACIAHILLLFLAVSHHNHWVPKVLIKGYVHYLLAAVLLMISLPYYLLVTPSVRLLAVYWRPIHIAFQRLDLLPAPTASASMRMKFLKYICRHSSNEHQTASSVYWREKIGQYSILQDYDRRRPLSRALLAWFQGLVQPQPSYRFIKHLPVEEEEIDMKKLDSMRELVADTLRAIDGPPTNGTRSLKIKKDEINRASQNRDIAEYDWLWTCKQETHTDTILIWHIATCYCDCDMTPSDNTTMKDARALSRYCAYLVAFLPEFLPEHSLTTKFVFQRVLQEVQQELGKNPMKEEEKHTKIRGLHLPDQPEQRTTFHKGVELGRQLEMINDDIVRWKVIAEFWAETILYIAPSDNAEAHMEHLAKGGEFITHLWAMLSNAGILKRATGEWHPPTASTTTEGSPPHQLTEASSSSNDEASTSSMSSPQIGPPTHQLTEALSSSIDEASTSDMSSPPRQTSEPLTNEKGKQLQILEDPDQQ